MKMTKKIMAVVIAAVATLGMASCKFGNFGGTQAGTKKNMTVLAENKGTSGKLFERGWKQLGSSETVQAIETKITIDMSKVTGYAKDTGTSEAPNWAAAESTDTGATEVNVVIGLIFDLHETTVKADAATEEKPAGKYYDFVLVGYQPQNKKYYIEQYSDVPDGLFKDASNKGSFDEVAKEVKNFNGVKVKYITDTSASKAWHVPNATEKAAIVTELNDALPAGDEASISTDKVNLQQITVKVTQATDGTYVINLGDKDWTFTPEANDSYKNKKTGKRQGGAGFYVNCPVGLAARANFNSDNTNTVGLLAEEF